MNLNFTQQRVKFSPKTVLDDAKSKMPHMIWGRLLIISHFAVSLVTGV